MKTDEAWLATLQAAAIKLRAVLQSALAGLSEETFAALLREPVLAGAEHAVRRMREFGQKQMPPELESLAADLNVDGLHAWWRLYSTLAGQMTFELTFPDGRVETTPMASRRALMTNPDRRVREAAFRDGQQPWNDHAVTLAAGLNGIAGARLTLYRRRGLHFLDTPLFNVALSRASLEAMFEAIHANLELPRRALRQAARLQGTPALHFFDLEAPQIREADERPLTWDATCATVEREFSSAYPRLGKYFREMLDKRWIEAQPRAGKRPGAFCSDTQFGREERAYMTFHGTAQDMVTLAHEVGHAWHSCILRPTRSLAATYPMTLGETASTFAELILLKSLMSDPDITPRTKAYLLDQEMLRAHAYLINIPMRFEFERAFYTARSSGELSVSGLQQLMVAAQHEWYGDTLLADGADPMFWASKIHFFVTDASFYNFPYTFGYLLSQALFARFQAEGSSFLPHYEEFLAMTGSATCEEVVRRSLGEDLTQPEFWATAMRAMEPELVAYEKLTRD